MKPTPPLIFFSQDAFPFVDIQIYDLLPLLNAKSKIVESFSTSLLCGSLVHSVETS